VGRQGRSRAAQVKPNVRSLQHHHPIASIRDRQGRPDTILVKVGSGWVEGRRAPGVGFYVRYHWSLGNPPNTPDAALSPESGFVSLFRVGCPDGRRSSGVGSSGRRGPDAGDRRDARRTWLGAACGRPPYHPERCGSRGRGPGNVRDRPAKGSHAPRSRFASLVASGIETREAVRRVRSMRRFLSFGPHVYDLARGAGSRPIVVVARRAGIAASSRACRYRSPLPGGYSVRETAAVLGVSEKHDQDAAERRAWPACERNSEMNDWPADPKLDESLRRLVNAELMSARSDARRLARHSAGAPLAGHGGGSPARTSGGDRDRRGPGRPREHHGGWSAGGPGASGSPSAHGRRNRPCVCARKCRALSCAHATAAPGTPGTFTPARLDDHFGFMAPPRCFSRAWF